MKPKDAKPGALVTCLHAVEAYYSGYAGNPKCLFEPGMVGEIVDTAPKVCIMGEPPVYDKRDIRLVVDFRHPELGIQRVSLNFCNAKAVKCDSVT